MAIVFSLSEGERITPQGMPNFEKSIGQFLVGAGRQTRNAQTDPELQPWILRDENGEPALIQINGELMVLCALLVTSSNRGIYFGFFLTKQDMYGLPALPHGDAIQMIGVRHCRWYGRMLLDDDYNVGYWSLATVGPSPDSQIGPAVPAVIRNIQNVLLCSKKAVERFDQQAWVTPTNG